MEESGQLHAPAALPPGKNLRIYGLGGWVGTRTGLDGFGRETILLPLPEFEALTVCPIA
jgi:hypothetical protein